MKRYGLLLVLSTLVAWLGREKLEHVMHVVHVGYELSLGSNLEEFTRKHHELYAVAQQDGNYTPVTLNYYSLFASAFTLAIGKHWHFIPADPRLSREENFGVLNQHFNERLHLRRNDTLCELGCGFCRTGREVARLSGARFIGVTMSPSEVELGNAEVEQLGMQDIATIVRGDYTAAPLANGACDAVLAVYTFKYSTPGKKLLSAFQEVSRILKPNGRFVSYEIVTTESFDERNETQAEWSRRISYHTGMPPLASVDHYREGPKAYGLRLDEEFDMQSREGVTPTWQSFPFNLQAEKFGGPLCAFADFLGLKKGLLDFWNTFAEHPTVDFVASLRDDVVSGSRIFTYERMPSVAE